MNNIIIEAKYNFKFACRNILFPLFLLVIMGMFFFQFTSLSEKGFKSLNVLLDFSMNWTSQVFPASIAYKTAFYFNIIQLLFVVAFVVDSSRNMKFRENITYRPVSNKALVMGDFLGKLLFFTLLNGIAFLFSMIVNACFFPDAFSVSTYLFYWFTLNLPALIYFLGVACLITRLCRQQGMNLFLCLLWMGVFVYYGADWCGGLVDPCARYIPNMFSDFLGHVNLQNYLLQRFVILLTGGVFLLLSMLPYRRLPNDRRDARKSVRVASLLLVVLVGTAFLYHHRHASIQERREVYRRVYEKHKQLQTPRVLQQDLQVNATAGENIRITSVMRVTNPHAGQVPLVLYLNPGLRLTSLKMDRKETPFEREHQAVVVQRVLQPGETVELAMQYDGVVEDDICFLDMDMNTYGFDTVNRVGIYHFGYAPAFSEEEYKLFTPELMWYPVVVPPCELETESGFTRYSLDVEHDLRLTAISQGNRREERKGRTRFTFDHDLQAISLCIGRYESRAIWVDSVFINLFYLPEHARFVEEFDTIPEKDAKLLPALRQFKRGVEREACVQTPEFTRKLYTGKADYKDRVQQYPYRWLHLVEVPCSFHRFANRQQSTGARVQAGILFVPEKKYSMDEELKFHPKADFHSKLFERIDFMKGGDCSVLPTLFGQTLRISSPEFPFLSHILGDLAKSDMYRPHVDLQVDDYDVVVYLNGKSLKEGLLDETLSIERVEHMLYKKVQELKAHLSLRMTEKQYRDFYLHFARKNQFREVKATTFFEEFKQTFYFPLDSLLEAWFTVRQLPLLKIEDIQVINMEGKEVNAPRPYDYYYNLYHFKVWNRSDVAGLVQIEDQHWLIPPRTGQLIKARGKKSTRKYTPSFKIPLAQNLPGEVRLYNRKTGDVHTDTTTGVWLLNEEEYTSTPKQEIIVDNEDPGFRVVRTENFLTELFRKEEKKTYYKVFSEKWLPTIYDRFYGYPIRSAYHKRTGEGKQKVEWKVSLPEAGQYEVFFHYVPLFEKYNNGGSGGKKTYYYTIFDGKKKHEVIATVSKEEENSWVSLGEFDFSKDAIITLSDKTLDPKKTHELVADAVKWVKVR